MRNLQHYKICTHNNIKKVDNSLVHLYVFIIIISMRQKSGLFIPHS